MVITMVFMNGSKIIVPWVTLISTNCPFLYYNGSIIMGYYHGTAIFLGAIFFTQHAVRAGTTRNAPPPMERLQKTTFLERQTYPWHGIVPARDADSMDGFRGKSYLETIGFAIDFPIKYGTVL